MQVKGGEDMSDKEKVNLVLFVVFATIAAVLYHFFPEVMKNYWIYKFVGNGIFIVFIVSLWVIGTVVLFLGNKITKLRKK